MARQGRMVLEPMEEMGAIPAQERATQRVAVEEEVMVAAVRVRRVLPIVQVLATMQEAQVAIILAVRAVVAVVQLRVARGMPVRTAAAVVEVVVTIVRQVATAAQVALVPSGMRHMVRAAAEVEVEVCIQQVALARVMEEQEVDMAAAVAAEVSSSSIPITVARVVPAPPASSASRIPRPGDSISPPLLHG